MDYTLDNFFLTQMHVRANQCNPILTIVTVTYADNPGIDNMFVIAVLSYFYRNR